MFICLYPWSCLSVICVFFRVIFVFHKNTTEYVKAKVKPPRLNGKRVGLFSTRSPYRPNAIGLTLAKLENISGIAFYFHIDHAFFSQRRASREIHHF